jgi:serine/threonine protein phosphatase 1
MAGRTFAIGDIHGDIAALWKLLAKFPQLDPGDTIVFLGDYVDRGPRSRDVVDYVRNLHLQTPAQVVCLRGNHEDAWLRVAERGWDGFVLPPINGCLAAYRSYMGGPTPEEGEEPQEHEKPVLMTAQFFPNDVLHWFYNLPHFYEDQHAIYVHAGLPKAGDSFLQPSQEPNPAIMLWSRTVEFFREYAGKTVIVGHTVTSLLPPELSSFSPDNPDDLWAGDRVIALDTGCGKGGFLSAIEIPELFVWESRDPLRHRTGPGSTPGVPAR